MVHRLGALGEVFAGLNVTRLEHVAGADEYRLISLKDVSEQITQPDLLGCVRALQADVDRFSVRVGDVLVTTRGTAIRTVVVKEAHQGAIAGANLAVVRLREGLLPVLLAALLRDPRTRTTLLRGTVGASTPGFTVRALRELPIKVPSRQRQVVLARLAEVSETYRAALMQAVDLRQQACSEIIAAELHTAVG
jgi:type I restriction enzyme M protein